MPAGELLLINPRRKRRVSRVSRNPRRKMSALQRQYFGGGRKRRKSRRRSVAVMSRNPRPVRRRRARTARYRRNPTIGGYARRAREAIGGHFIGKTLLPSAIGGAGALALDISLAVLPVPASMKTGALGVATRVAGAIGIGMLSKMFLGARFGEQAMAGALVVTLYDAMKTGMMTYAPSVPLNGLGWTSAALNTGPMGVYIDGGQGYAADGGYDYDNDGLGVYV